MNGAFWLVVYLGVLGAAVLRRRRQAHPKRDLGRAGDEENPDQELAYREWGVLS